MPSGLAQIAPPLPEYAPRRGVAWLERVGVDLLVWVGVALIGVPLLLTLYLSLFDEKLILFPPHGYTLSWYAAILPNFGDPIVTSLELAAAAVCGSLLLGVPAGIGLSRHGSVLGFGMDAQLSPRAALKLSYDYERGQYDSARGVTAGLNVAF